MRLQTAGKIGCRPCSGPVFVLLLAAFLGTSCKTSYYQNSADKEVYKIIEQAEQDVFGRKSPFTIETQHTWREVDEVLVLEILENRQESNTVFLTIEGALELAVKNSRDYQTEKEQLYLTALTLTGARYEFSPHFFAGGSGSFRRNSDGEKVFTGDGQMGVSQALQSGGSLGLTLANDFLRYYTGDPRQSLASSISINLVQPLLRGAGKSIAAESLKQAERNVIYAMRSYSQFQRQFTVDIVLAYFELLQNKDQLRNAYEDYNRRLQTIQYTEARGEAGLQSQLEVDEARSGELSAKNSYISAATTYLNNLDRFKITLGLPLTTEIQLDDKALEELSELGLSPLPLDKEQAFKIAVDHHLDLLNNIDRFEDSKRKVSVAANQLKADLNIFADASLDSRRGDQPIDYTKFNFDDVRGGVGIELDLPIDRLRERNNYRSTLVSFESAIRTLSLDLDNKKNQVDQGLRNLESLRRAYFIQEQATAIAERRVEGEQLSFQAGRRTMLNVRDAQDNLIRAQNDLTDLLVRHLDAKLQLLLDIGILNTDVARFWVKADAVTIPLEQILQPEKEMTPEDEIVPPERIFGL